jgi:hypothetical protein
MQVFNVYIEIAHANELRHDSDNCEATPGI